MTLANTALVFLERDVELPMQTVFDAPVAAHRLGKAAGRQVFAQHVVADITAVLARALRAADHDADRLQTGPTRAVRQVIRQWADEVMPGLLAAVSSLVRFVTAHAGAGKVVFHVIVEELDDPLVQRGLVALHGQTIIRASSDDL